MSYGYMIFSKKPSNLLVKRRITNFRLMPDCDDYKVYYSYYENPKGFVNREEVRITVSNDGDAFLSDLYAEIGTFFFVYFLFTYRMGETDAAKNFYSLILNNSIARYNYDRNISIQINVPYLIYRSRYE